MTDAATLDSAVMNGSTPSKTPSTKGQKRENNRSVGGSQTEVKKTSNDYSTDSTAISWRKLRNNKPFSPNPSGVPLCVKVSASSYVEVWTGTREVRIGDGMVYPCYR